MKNYLILFFIFFSFQFIKAQEINSGVSDKIYNINEVDVKPDFPKGIKFFYSFIGNNFQPPTIAGLNGKVVVSYVVETDGTLSNLNVIEDMGYGTAEEALRVFRKCPKWIPGQLQGKLVRVINSIPITVMSAN